MTIEQILNNETGASVRTKLNALITNDNDVFTLHASGGDDTTAIQTALDNHSTVYLPDPLYRISSVIEVPSDRKMYGAGQYLTTIEPFDFADMGCIPIIGSDYSAVESDPAYDTYCTDGNFTFHMLDIGDKQRIELSDFALTKHITRVPAYPPWDNAVKGEYYGPGGYAIDGGAGGGYSTTTKDILIERLYVHHLPTAGITNYLGGERWRVNHCHIAYTGRGGISGNGWRMCSFEGNYFEKIGDDGFGINSHGFSCSFVNNTFNGVGALGVTGASAIKMHGQSMTITGNAFYGCLHGVWVKHMASGTGPDEGYWNLIGASRDVVISGNTFYKNPDPTISPTKSPRCIETEGVENLLIANNTMYAVDTDGAAGVPIYISHSRNAKIIGNQIVGSTCVVGYSQNTNFTDNTFVNVRSIASMEISDGKAVQVSDIYPSTQPIDTDITFKDNKVSENMGCLFTVAKADPAHLTSIKVSGTEVVSSRIVGRVSEFHDITAADTVIRIDGYRSVEQRGLAFPVWDTQELILKDHAQSEVIVVSGDQLANGPILGSGDDKYQELTISSGCVNSYIGKQAWLELVKPGPTNGIERAIIAVDSDAEATIEAFDNDLPGWELSTGLGTLTVATHGESNTGTPVGSLTPQNIGQEYFDTSNKIWYKSTGLTSSDWQVIDDDSITIREMTATGDFVLADGNNVVQYNSASAGTLTIPLNATVAFPIGTAIEVHQVGVGVATIAGPGVTLNNRNGLSTEGQHAITVLRKVATDTWTVNGDRVNSNPDSDSVAYAYDYGCSPSSSGLVNSQAIQAALDSGAKTVILPAGTLTVTNNVEWASPGRCIVVDRSTVTLAGQGMYSTTLSCDGPYTVIYSPNEVEVTFRDFGITQNAQPEDYNQGGGYGIMLGGGNGSDDWSQRNTCENLWVRDTFVGSIVCYAGSSNFIMRGCRVERSGRGLVNGGWRTATFTNNYFGTSGDDAIGIIYSGNSTIISGNIFDGCSTLTQDAAAINTSAGPVTIDGNTFRNCNFAIKLHLKQPPDTWTNGAHKTKGVLISNNTFYYQSYVEGFANRGMIYCPNGDEVTITGNRIKAIYASGYPAYVLELGNVSNVYCSNNVWEGRAIKTGGNCKNISFFNDHFKIVKPLGATSDWSEASLIEGTIWTRAKLKFDNCSVSSNLGSLYKGFTNTEMEVEFSGTTIGEPTQAAYPLLTNTGLVTSISLFSEIEGLDGLQYQIKDGQRIYFVKSNGDREEMFVDASAEPSSVFLAGATQIKVSPVTLVNSYGQQDSWIELGPPRGTLSSASFGLADLSSTASATIKLSNNEFDWTASNGAGVLIDLRQVVGQNGDTHWVPKSDLSGPNPPSGVTPVVIGQRYFDTVSETWWKSTGLNKWDWGQETLSYLPPDTTIPTPDPATWLTVPEVSSASEIFMAATVGNDPSNVEYYFTCVTGGGNDSGWQMSNEWTATGLTADTLYGYTVKYRDQAETPNEGQPSVEGQATIVIDQNAPVPNPSEWEVLPFAVSSTEISMTLKESTDPEGNGVEYYCFDIALGPSLDPDVYQDSNVFNFTGLDPNTEYTFAGICKDKAVTGAKYTTWSSFESATTLQ